MGVSVYWLIVAIIIGCGMILPQRGSKKTTYVILLAAVHTFVCGFRYMHLVGDLMKYHYGFNTLMDIGYFSPAAFQGSRNFLFNWVMKAIADLSGGNFQLFLMLLAIITEVIVAVLIFRYSPQPWLSYLVWDCMAFFITYGMCAIKQGLAMAILMCAFMCIIEEKPRQFLAFTVIAGLIHMPALCFLPAYWLARRRVNQGNMFTYILTVIVIFILRTPIVRIVSAIYYEGGEDKYSLDSMLPGGRFMVISLMLLCGLFIKGFQEKNFEKLFNIMIVAAIFQMFSGFDNVFTRLADYYLQFTVLYIPMLFYRADSDAELNTRYVKPIVAFSHENMTILVALISIVLMWWYWRTCLSAQITYAVDDYTNFRFMWDVVTDVLW